MNFLIFSKTEISKKKKKKKKTDELLWSPKIYISNEKVNKNNY